MRIAFNLNEDCRETRYYDERADGWGGEWIKLKTLINKLNIKRS